MFERIALELTYRCNLRCSFCYLLHSRLLNRKRRELGTREVCAVVDRFGPGAHFYLSGGEPFLRPDLLEILAHIRRAGSHFGLNTNGTLLTPALAGPLAALRPDYVVFSMHGAEAVHDRLSGKKGVWRLLMRNLRSFAAAARPGTEIIVNCVVNRENAGELLKVYNYAARAGAHRVLFEHLQFLRPREAARTPARLRAGGMITPRLKEYGADAAMIFRQFEAIRRRGRVGAAHFEVRPSMSERELDAYYNHGMTPAGTCAKALDTVHVEPDGRIRLCVLYGLEAGHALKTDPASILAFKKSRLGGAMPGGCARCCHRFKIDRIF